MLTDDYEPLKSEPPALLSTFVQIGTTYLGLFDPTMAAAVAVANILGDALSRAAQMRKLEELQAACQQFVSSDDLKREVLAAKLSSDDAKDAIVAAVLQTLRSTRLDQVKRYGAVLGSQLARDDPNWAEAAEFIRDLERFSDDDVDALKILWRVDRFFSARLVNSNARSINRSTAANNIEVIFTAE